MTRRTVASVQKEMDELKETLRRRAQEYFKDNGHCSDIQEALESVGIIFPKRTVQIALEFELGSDWEIDDDEWDDAAKWELLREMNAKYDFYSLSETLNKYKKFDVKVVEEK